MIPDKKVVDETIKNLEANGINVLYVESGALAKDKLIGIIPRGSSVTAGASVTLETIGVKDEIDKSGRYVSHRVKAHTLDKKTQGREIKNLRSIADYAIGSVHAITRDGRLMFASQTGSQLPAYVYGADKVIWVAGVHKIVDSIEEGMKRIYEYCLPKEKIHMKELYNMSSAVNKLLIFNAEPVKDRATIILVNEVLGF